MKNKYYTPTIEEILNSIINRSPLYQIDKDNEIIEIYYFDQIPIENTLHTFIEYNDCKLTYDFENNIIREYSINPNLYLLKYLDKDDLESLGFKHTIGQWYEYKSLVSQFNSGVYTLKLSLWNDNKVILTLTDASIDDEIIFNGVIKNKSELKQILKQLDITWI